jgi:hypothetical protein
MGEIILRYCVKGCDLKKLPYGNDFFFTRAGFGVKEVSKENLIKNKNAFQGIIDEQRNKMRKVTEDDLSYLRYQWEEKYMTADEYYNYSEIEADLKETYPEIVKASQEVKASKEIYKLVLSNISFKATI